MAYRFLEADKSIDSNDIIIIGYPFDCTSSFRSGSRNGPHSLRFYSENLETYSPYQDKDIHTKNYADIGDADIIFGDVEKTVDIIYKNTKILLEKKKKIISIGGEHTITYPIIKAYNGFYSDFIMIVFDAHADLRKDYMGLELSHACTSNLCSQIIGKDRLCVIGARSYTHEEKQTADEILFFNEDINKFSFDLIKDKKIYISIDLDVLDPSIMSGTGTPEPGGVFFKEFIDFLIKFKQNEIIGIDIVELSPDYDNSGVSSITAAKILRECILLL